MKVVSSITGEYWHIVNPRGEIVAGAPKRGEGSATKKKMEAWALEKARELGA